MIKAPDPGLLTLPTRFTFSLGILAGSFPSAAWTPDKNCCALAYRASNFVSKTFIYISSIALWCSPSNDSFPFLCNPLTISIVFPHWSLQFCFAVLAFTIFDLKLHFFNPWLLFVMCCHVPLDGTLDWLNIIHLLWREIHRTIKNYISVIVWNPSWGQERELCGILECLEEKHGKPARFRTS